MALGDALRSWLDVAADNGRSRARALRNCQLELERHRAVDDQVAELCSRLARTSPPPPVTAGALERSA